VAWGNVAVDLAVNQEDWNLGGAYCIFWRNVLHVQAVLPANVEKGEFDYRAEDGASEPGAEVKGLAHAVVGDLAETGEGRFCGDGTEARLVSERLQELGGSHRFSKSEDAMRVNSCGEKVETLVDVVSFEKAVGGKLTSACAVGSCVRKKDVNP
jgi:hypothetical protein